MSIRLKAVVALVVTLTCLVGVLYFVLGSLLGQGFGAVEERDARRNVERLREAVANETAGLCQKVNDWAYWDDAYRYAADRNALFVETNVAATTFQGMQLDLLLIFGANGELLTGSSYDPASASMGAVPESLVAAHFAPGSALLEHTGKGSVHSGLVLAPGQPAALVCSMPILTTDGEGPVRGSIVFARYAGEAFKALLSKVTRLDVRMAAEGDPSFGGEFAAVLPRLSGPDSIDVQAVSEEQLVGSTRYAAVHGTGSLVLRAQMPREIHREARRTVGLVLVALVITGLGFAVVIVVLLEVLVLGRVSRVATAVSHITETFDFSARVAQEGRDEIGRLGGAVNGLLAAVEQVTWSSGDAESRCAALHASLPVALVSLEVLDGAELQLLELSAAASRLLGLRADAPGRTLRELLPGGDEPFARAAEAAIRGDGPQSFVVTAKGGKHPATAARIGERRVLVYIGAEGR